MLVEMVASTSTRVSRRIIVGIIQCRCKGSEKEGLDNRQRKVGYDSESFELLTALSFNLLTTFQTFGASNAGCFEPPFLGIGLGDDRSSRQWLAVLVVDANEGELGSAGMYCTSGAWVFHFDADADLHGGIEDAIDRCFQGDHLAELDRFVEAQAIDRGSDADTVGVAHRRERRSDIDPVHQPTAE